MNILPRQSLFLLVCGLVLVCVFTGVLVPAPVRADVGVQPVLPGGSSSWQRAVVVGSRVLIERCFNISKVAADGARGGLHQA